MPTPNEILAELKKVKYPGFNRDIVSFGMIKDIEVAHSGVTVFLNAVSHKAEVVAAVTESISKAVGAMAGVAAVDIKVEQPPPARAS